MIQFYFIFQFALLLIIHFAILIHRNFQIGQDGRKSIFKMS